MQWASLAITGLSAILVFRTNLGTLRILAISAATGVVATLTAIA